MGRKPKKKPVSKDVRLAAFEQQCQIIADAVKLIKTNLNELLSAEEAAKMCGMGKTSFLKLASAGKMPASVKLDRLRRWRRKEIVAWIAAGCPDKPIRKMTETPRKSTRQSGGK